MKAYLILFFIFSAIASFSQNEPKAELNSAGQASIEFSSVETIKDVIMIITDSTGNTVFFEQIEKHSGNYLRTINLKESGRGTYHLKLMRDENIFSASLTVQ